MRHPCIACLLDTEKRTNEGFEEASEGNKIWYENSKAELIELKKNLKKYSPQNIIEIGAGAGRVISNILDVVPHSRIRGYESTPEMHLFLQKRFNDNLNVEIYNQNFIESDFIYYANSLSVCMMNTIANNEPEKIISKSLEVTDRLVFTVYAKGYENERIKMYEARGHTDFSCNKGNFRFRDFWVDGLKSDSFRKEEMDLLINRAGASVERYTKKSMLHYYVVK